MNKLSAKLISVVLQKDINRAYEDDNTVYFYERNDSVINKMPLLEYLAKLTQYLKNIDKELSIDKVIGTLVLSTKFKGEFIIGETPKELLLKVGKQHLKSLIKQ